MSIELKKLNDLCKMTKKSLSDNISNDYEKNEIQDFMTNERNAHKARSIYIEIQLKYQLINEISKYHYKRETIFFIESHHFIIALYVLQLDLNILNCLQKVCAVSIIILELNLEFELHKKKSKDENRRK